MTAELAKLVFDAGFEVWGETAEFQPAGGPAVPGVRLIRVNARDDFDLTGQSFPAGENRWEAYKSAVPGITAGDRFAFADGTTRVVQGTPKSQDTHGLKWVLDLREV